MSLTFVLNRVASLSFFEYMDLISSNFITPKLSRNIVSATHAIGTIALAGSCLLVDKKQFESIYSLVKIFSTGYFLFDSHYILQYEKLTLMRLAGLYHHIAIIYYIHQDPIYYAGHKLLFWGELSNIPSYFVYHYLQKNLINNYTFKIWSILQKILYTGIRLPILGSIMIDILQKVSRKGPIFLLFPVYLMGIIWTYKLLRQKH